MAPLRKYQYLVTSVCSGRSRGGSPLFWVKKKEDNMTEGRKASRPPPSSRSGPTTSMDLSVLSPYCQNLALIHSTTENTIKNITRNT